MNNTTTTTATQREIELTRVNNDVNGNPRYVFHFLNLSGNYETALKLAKKIGGRKFNNKQYGGGIIIQSYNIADTQKQIIQLISK